MKIRIRIFTTYLITSVAVIGLGNIASAWADTANGLFNSTIGASELVIYPSNYGGPQPERYAERKRSWHTGSHRDAHLWYHTYVSDDHQFLSAGDVNAHHAHNAELDYQSYFGSPFAVGPHRHRIVRHRDRRRRR